MPQHVSANSLPSRLQHIAAQLYRSVYKLLASERFFYLSMAFFLLQVIWIAISGAYSMAFDEYYHYGIIELYRHTWTPFIQQPEGPAFFGAVARDPSFLYHYLLSFPHRLFAFFVPNMALQVIFLRSINTVMFAAGVLIFRKILRRLRLSKIAVHIVLVLFLLLPVSGQLAAQLNYDNAQFALVAATIYICLLIVDDWRSHSRLSLTKLLVWAAVVMAGCLVKFTFLPFALTSAVFLFCWAWWIWHSDRTKLVRQARGMWSISVIRQWRFIFLAVNVLLLLGLCIQRYGVNIVKYHSLAPRCNVVLAHEVCMDYDPYRRDTLYVEQGYHQIVTADSKRGYPRQWFEQMIWETYFVVGNRQQDYPVGDPLPVAYKTGRVVAYALLITLAAGSIYVLRTGGAAVWLCVGMIAVYTGILYARNYHDFMRVGVPVAIHARYLVPLFPLVGGLAVLALRPLQTRFRHVRRGIIAMGALVILLTVQGGGALPYIIRSNDTWMWPQMAQPNRVVRSALWPLISK